jgi:hypothetical protein
MDSIIDCYFPSYLRGFLIWICRLSRLRAKLLCGSQLDARAIPKTHIIGCNIRKCTCFISNTFVGDVFHLHPLVSGRGLVGAAEILPPLESGFRPSSACLSKNPVQSSASDSLLLLAISGKYSDDNDGVLGVR